jgi:hypothetical protein
MCVKRVEVGKCRYFKWIEGVTGPCDWFWSMLYRMPLCLLVTLGQVHELRKGNVVNVDVLSLHLISLYLQ